MLAFSAVPAMLLRCIKEVCMVSLTMDCWCWAAKNSARIGVEILALNLKLSYQII